MFFLHFFPMPIPNSHTKKNKSNISKASCESWSVVGGIRNQYQRNGDAKTYYENNGEAYTNPHFSRLREVLPGTLFDDIVVPKILVPSINAKKKTKNKGTKEDDEHFVEETTT